MSTIIIDDPARQHRPVRVKTLPGHFQAQLVQPANQSQISAGEARGTGSVSHVEVFRDGRVGTLILGRPRHLSRDRRANLHHTVNCDEPLSLATSGDRYLANSGDFFMATDTDRWSALGQGGGGEGEQ